jgi:hypothetical protein
MRYSIPRLYYLVTPAFIALDYWAGVNVRVAVLDSMPLYKSLYYGFCVLCGVLVYLLPASSAGVALVESSINILLTVLAVFLPYVHTIMLYDDALTQRWDPMAAFDASHIINLLLSGGIAVIAFKESTEALRRQFTDATLGPRRHDSKER